MSQTPPANPNVLHFPQGAPHASPGTPVGQGQASQTFQQHAPHAAWQPPPGNPQPGGMGTGPGGVVPSRFPAQQVTGLNGMLLEYGSGDEEPGILARIPWWVYAVVAGVAGAAGGYTLGRYMHKGRK